MNTKFPLPTAPSAFTQRVMKRRALKSLSNENLFEVGIPDKALAPTNDNDSLLAIGIEELIARLVLVALPEAHTIQLVEDISHDDPHGHVGKIFDVNHALLADGFSDEWHNLDWTHEVDEAAWDFHHYGKVLFTKKDDAGRNTIVIPSRVI